MKLIGAVFHLQTPILRDASVPEALPREGSSCSDKVVFEHFGKSAELPTGELVAVELMPKEAGEFAFACPMGMFRGRLIVE